ncbi:uncharacterized protein LOC124493735 [Dermatophagoides farinae]|uniref:Peptidase S1 domain-containing protein n=1 Tax=Dermatophagoides farinae TaxID=6954 RepID=A0A922L1Z0_DERFA|nr:hypothetical protein DERF_013067 [Dermatophagoides farinae]
MLNALVIIQVANIIVVTTIVVVVVTCTTTTTTAASANNIINTNIYSQKYDIDPRLKQSNQRQEQDYYPNQFYHHYHREKQPKHQQQSQKRRIALPDISLNLTKIQQQQQQRRRNHLQHHHQQHIASAAAAAAAAAAASIHLLTINSASLIANPNRIDNGNGNDDQISVAETSNTAVANYWPKSKPLYNTNIHKTLRTTATTTNLINIPAFSSSNSHIIYSRLSPSSQSSSSSPLYNTEYNNLWPRIDHSPNYYYPLWLHTTTTTKKLNNNNRNRKYNLNFESPSSSSNTELISSSSSLSSFIPITTTTTARTTDIVVGYNHHHHGNGVGVLDDDDDDGIGTTTSSLSSTFIIDDHHHSHHQNQDYHDEFILDRTAPDTSAGFFAKALDNVVRFLPTMRMRDRQNPGCVGGTKCQFFVFCWMSGGSLGASCGPLHTCCVTPSSQDIQPKYWGPVINDPQCGKSATRISRIVGGSDASFGQFPWQAFVQVGGSRCGGALVGPAHVVTAGHCVARSQHNPSSIRVTLGDYILHSEIESLPHEVFTVSEVKLHPNFRFTPQADRYDVAVLVLDRSVQYRENIMPICLPPKDTIYIGRMSYVAGWGALQAGSKLRPKVLQHVPVPVIENNICENWHKQRGINIKIYDEMMCAGYETGGKDACQGDSGGPLMLNEFGVWYLIGIVSAGYSCAKQYQPGIYHRVSSSSDWVSANVFPSAHFRVPS